MELVALYKRVIGLDVHQAQITACALLEEPDGTSAHRAAAIWRVQAGPPRVG